MKPILIAALLLSPVYAGDEVPKFETEAALEAWLGARADLSLEQFQRIYDEISKLRQRSPPPDKNEEHKLGQLSSTTKALLLARFSKAVKSGDGVEVAGIFAGCGPGGLQSPMLDILEQEGNRELGAMALHADMDWKSRWSRLRRTRPDIPFAAKHQKYYRELTDTEDGTDWLPLGSIVQEDLARLRLRLEQKFPALAELEGSETRKAREAADPKRASTPPPPESPSESPKPAPEMEPKPGLRLPVGIIGGLVAFGLALLVAFVLKGRSR